MSGPNNLKTPLAKNELSRPTSGKETNVRMPLVSVLTPSLNQSQFVGSCIRTVAEQTYSNWQQVVQDGGSTDSTLDVLQEFLVSEPRRLTWRSSKDEGQGDAVNRCLQRADGEIISWLNSDDGFASTRTLEQVVTCFERNPDVDVVFGDGLYVSGSGEVMRYVSSKWPSGIQQTAFSPVLQPAVFIRRRILEKFGFLNSKLHFCMDYDLWLRLSDAGVRTLHIKSPLSFDREHAARKTRLLSSVHERELLILEKAYGKSFDKVESYPRKVYSRARDLPRLLNQSHDLSAGLRLPRISTMIQRQLLKPHSGLLDGIGVQPEVELSERNH